MICGQCAKGADYFNKFGNRMVAEEYHSRCVSSHCDCQHKIGHEFVRKDGVTTP